MSGRAFLDTNVLVYAYDRHEPRKQSIAQSLLTEAFRSENVALSTQVLGELFTVVTRRIPSRSRLTRPWSCWSCSGRCRWSRSTCRW